MKWRRALITLDSMIAGADIMNAVYNLLSGKIAPAITELVLAVALIAAVCCLWGCMDD